MSRDVYKEMCDLLENKDIVNRHSFFQMKYFIVNKEPTHQAKLWRCLRELHARKDVIEATRVELDDCRDNLELTEIEIKKLNICMNFKTPEVRSGVLMEIPEIEALNKEESTIRERKLERKKQAILGTIASLEKKSVEIQEESAFFVEAFRSLEKIAQLKPFDDLTSQKEYWNEKIAQEFQLRALTGMPADVDLARTTMCLMDDMPVKGQFLQALEKKKQLENLKG
jgi:hypothetical protein